VAVMQDIQAPIVRKFSR